VAAKSGQFTTDKTEGPVPPRKLKESGRRGSCEKDMATVDI